MSILINMEMPESCAFCRIKRRNGKKMVCPLCGEEWDVHDPMSADHRLDNCPLVPVPAHGRLIDADALLKKCEFVCADDDVDVRAVRYSVIDAAPTIIPAEEGE